MIGKVFGMGIFSEKMTLLREKAASSRGATLLVGYKAPYAIYVHEMIYVKNRQGQVAKTKVNTESKSGKIRKVLRPKRVQHQPTKDQKKSWRDRLDKNKVRGAKFLERAYRRHRIGVIKVIRSSLKLSKAGGKRKLTGSYAEAMLKGARYLMKRSRELVPIDTGYLMNSWFIRRLGGAVVDSGTSYDKPLPPRSVRRGGKKTKK